jgi:hypothetical protein
MALQPRQHVRYPVEVPVIFSWKDQKGVRHQQRGSTRDISPGGMYLFSSTSPPVGAEIGLDALLPPLSVHAPHWRMLAHGRVVRVERPQSGGKPGGFAAVSERVIVRAV